MTAITFTGVSTHNLKGIDVALPHYQITAVTGVSGSGKTSLVFDTVYAEAYRRYLDSLSGFTRQHLQVMSSANFLKAEGLPAAVAIRQARPTSHPRSSVGTLTEIFDLLRNFFPYIAAVHCCGREVREEHPEFVIEALQKALPPAEQVTVLAPLQHFQMAAGELGDKLREQGFQRVELDGVIHKLEEKPVLDPARTRCVIDRVGLETGKRPRLLEALRLGYRLGRGRIVIRDQAGHEHLFSTRHECSVCGTPYRRLSPALFSSDNPLGACPDCQGFGATSALDPDRVVRDHSKSLADGGVDLFNFGSRENLYGPAAVGAKRRRMPFDKPFSKYTQADWDWLYAGDGEFCGVKGFVDWLESKRYKAHYRIHLARFRKYEPCVACESTGLGIEARRAEASGMRFTVLASQSIEGFGTWLNGLDLTGADPRTAIPALRQRQSDILGEIARELAGRISYLLKIGVGYLQLNRKSRTLSGGEFQRINMARTLANELTESLVCLDEPTSGLHPCDCTRLSELIEALKGQHNTVLMVEHSRDIIAACDRIVEIGPAAGEHGGRITYDGPADGYEFKEFHAEKPAAARGKTVGKAKGPSGKAEFFGIKGAKTHNLKGINVDFRFGGFNAVCGVSGSGKSSLIAGTLYPAVYSFLHGKPVENAEGAAYAGLSGESIIRRFSDVLLVSQKGIGRSSRSTIGTYLDVFGQVRKLFAGTESARRLKLTPRDFSFNVPGGRCEKCQGLGYVVEDLSFLGEVKVVCPDCEGMRFQERVLSVTYRGISLSDLLHMSVDDALEFFKERPAISDILHLTSELGLGYLRLGQTTDTFSGGEAQRLKLLDILKEINQRPQLIIFDEPSTGLSDVDLSRLFRTFQKLTEKGHTIITVEHHMAMCAASDWLIEIGPEASERGGDVIFQGQPHEIVQAPRSVTKDFMTEFLK